MSLTSIRDSQLKLSSKRVPAYDPYDIKVGRTTLVGIPFLRNAQLKPVDVLYQQSRISDSPRLGESLSLPSRDAKISGSGDDCQCGGKHTPEHVDVYVDQEGGEYIPVQVGEGFFKTLKKGFKKAKKIAKVVKKGAKIVKDVAGVADKLGVPGASTVKRIAGKTQKTLKMVGVGADDTEYYQDQEGGGFFKKLKKGIKKGVKFVKKASKATKGVSKVVGDVAEALGKDEIAKKARKVQKISGKVQKVSKALSGEGQTAQATGRSGNPFVMKGNGLPEDMQFLKGLPRSIVGGEKMAFIPTHPLNYATARLTRKTEE